MRQTTHRAFRSCTFVINPSRLPEYTKILKKILRRAEVPKLVETRSKEHFAECVREFCRGDDRHLLVWGGDGTAHDAVNVFTVELLKNPDIGQRKSIGFLRGGSGNGIQDSYEVPYGIRKQVATYAESTSKNYVVDVDLLETSHGGVSSFCQLVGFGLDAHVLKTREGYRYKRGAYKGLVRKGVGSYLRSFASNFLLNYETTHQELTLRLYRGNYAFRGTRVNAEMPFDSLERQTDAVQVEAGSRPYYGRMLKICPDVVCNDGRLDIYVYNFETRLSILANAVWLWTGRHDRINKKLAKDEKPLIERYEVDQVDVCSTKPFYYHIDGEVKRTTEQVDGHYTVSVRILPRRLSFLVPAEFYRKFHPFEGL